MISRRKLLSFSYPVSTCFLGSVILTTLLPLGVKKYFVAAHQATKNMLQESGDFIGEINRLKQLAIPKKSDKYQPPTDEELKKFQALATSLIFQDIEKTITLADELNYEVVDFFDIPTQQKFYGLREKSSLGKKVRGWGSYFINPTYRTDALIEIPHVIFDRFSEEIGAKVFLKSAAHGFLIAGAHRNANGINTADVCRSPNSIFHEVHKTWVSSKTRTKTWQIHGFDLATKSTFPDGTQAILSDGQGNISNEILNLNQRLISRGFKNYVFNKLSISTQLNQQVNEGFAGTTFLHLGATQNLQGIYCHSLQAAFVHIELNESIRNSTAERDTVATAIAESVQAVT